jgi:hypothetical protein
MDEQDHRVKCPRCGGDAYVDEDGRRVPIATAPNPCACEESERPPHWGP